MVVMNVDKIFAERLVLRKLNKNDIEDIFNIFSNDKLMDPMECIL